LEPIATDLVSREPLPARRGGPDGAAAAGGEETRAAMLHLPPPPRPLLFTHAAKCNPLPNAHHRTLCNPTQAGHHHASSAAAAAPTAWTPGVADAEAAAAVSDEPPSDGTVQYRAAPLWTTIQEHYAKLAASMPDYTARVDLDTFGSLYVEQVRREEAARQAALAVHQQQVEKQARQGRPGRQVGGVLSNLMRSWTQLLEEAVEAEHQEVRGEGVVVGVRERGRCRHRRGSGFH
jgi:hypothetical protein